ncbi:hypothetical protein S245_036771 [Arachis hypogaea]
MDIPPKEDSVLNDACNTQNMSLATDCDLITVNFGDQIGTTIPSAKDDLVINDGVIQSKNLNKSEELFSKVEEVLRSMEIMRVVNMVRDEQIDKILESVSRIETMISQLSLNNDFETPTKLSVQNTRSFSNRLKAKSSPIDIHTAISDDEDDLIELDKRSFLHDDAFKIDINMDNPVSPTIRAATKKKNISKGNTTMGIQKKLPFISLGGIRKPKIESKSSNKSKASYALSQSTSGYRRPIYFFSIMDSMQCKFMPTPTMRLLEDQIKACAYAFSASLDPSEELVVTDTIRAIRSDFEHFIPDRTIIDKILELAALRCTDDQSDVSFKTTWQLPPRFVANLLEQVIKSNFYKDDGIQEYNKQFHDYKITRPDDLPQYSLSLNSATWVMNWMDMTFEFKPNGNNKLEDHDIRMITAIHILRSRINHKKSQIITSVDEFWNLYANHEM